ncbi:MAG: hypothetical protein JNJ41_02050 [Bacteroidia bacterium]|nr:hypothetical protein [Bacteroidia bacterium]
MKKILENPTYKDIKENLSIVLLLPAVLGSIWQIVELASIQTAFIRFFSVTQLVADGALILFLMFFGFIGLRITRSFFKDKHFSLGTKEEEHKRKGITIALLLISSFVIYIVFVPAVQELYKSERISPIILLAFLPMSVIVLTLFLSSLASLLKAYGISLDKIKHDGLRQLLTGLAAVSIFFLSVKLLLFTASAFHKSFLMPENVVNTEYVKCKFNKSKKRPVNNLKMVYFNDKFVFIEFTQKDSILVEVLPFESFTEPAHCDSLRIK